MTTPFFARTYTRDSRGTLTTPLYTGFRDGTYHGPGGKGDYEEACASANPWSVAQRRRREHARDYGTLTRFVVLLGEDQLYDLERLGGPLVTEHIRRAVDAYIEVAA